MRLIAKILQQIALAIFGTLVVVLLIVFALPTIVVVETWAALAVRRFRRREDGRVFLICSSRRGWHDFLVNNLIPALPPGSEVHWERSMRDQRPAPPMAYFRRAGIHGVARPVLVLVTRKRVVYRTLNQALQEWKARPARSTRAREACREFLEAAVERMSA